MDDLISRQAAIEAIMDADVCVTWNGVISDDDAVDIAIKSTKGSVISSIVNMPSAQPETHEERTETHACDCISRQAAMDAVEFGITYAKAINKSTGEVKELFKEGNKALNDAVERIKDLPSAQSEPSQAARDIATILENEKDMRVIKKNAESESCADTISRKAAIDALMKRDKELRNINWYDKPFAEGECKGIDDALEIINTLPSAQSTMGQVFDRDTINRQAAIDICNNAIDLWHGQLGEGIVIAVKKKIEELPSAHPEMIREIRKWINSSNRGNADYFIVDKIEEIINKYE